MSFRSLCLPAIMLVPSCHIAVSLHMQSGIYSQREDGLFAVSSGDRMQPGDRLVAAVRLDRPAHVYVVHVDARGGQVRLYPEQDDEPLGAGIPLRIPARGFFSSPPNLVVITAERPLSPSKLLQQVEQQTRARSRTRPSSTPRRLVTREVRSPPEILGEVRGTEEMRRIAMALDAVAETHSGDETTIRLWLSPAETQGATRTNGAQ